MKVVNCGALVNLRTEPDGNNGRSKAEINRNKTVMFLRSDINGYYFVSYGKDVGYILAAYLVPADSEIFRNAMSGTAYDKVFYANDLTINNITINETSKDDVHGKYGKPIKIIDANQTIIWEYNDQSFVIRKSDGIVIKIILFDVSANGPRNIHVGMNMAEALNTFKMDSTSILSESSTHDLVLYSSTLNTLDGSYGYIHNKGTAGNGTITFYDKANKSYLVMAVKNSVITQISVYAE